MAEIRSLVKKSTPSPDCFQKGIEFKQCKFLIVSGDPGNPTFSCGDPQAKDEERGSDCNHGVYVVPQEK